MLSSLSGNEWTAIIVAGTLLLGCIVGLLCYLIVECIRMRSLTSEVDRYFQRLAATGYSSVREPLKLQTENGSERYDGILPVDVVVPLPRSMCVTLKADGVVQQAMLRSSSGLFATPSKTSRRDSGSGRPQYAAVGAPRSIAGALSSAAAVGSATNTLSPGMDMLLSPVIDAALQVPGRGHARHTKFETHYVVPSECFARFVSAVRAAPPLPPAAGSTARSEVAWVRVLGHDETYRGQRRIELWQALLSSPAATAAAAASSASTASSSARTSATASTAEDALREPLIGSGGAEAAAASADLEAHLDGAASSAAADASKLIALDVERNTTEALDGTQGISRGQERLRTLLQRWAADAAHDSRRPLIYKQGLESLAAPLLWLCKEHRVAASTDAAACAVVPGAGDAPLASRHARQRARWTQTRMPSCC